MSDQKLRALIDHFSRYRLRNEDFEFPDLLGAAYEYLIRDFADTAGKKGGEFYTPRSVVRMMVRIAQPAEGMRIYDPCSGSGGMLIFSKEFLDEHAMNAKNLRLYGQESNGSVWSISKMNMLLHGIAGADIQNDDTLSHPLHREGGELLRFDRVITNPPFSQNYSREGIPYPERFRFGFSPETGKKADLMFVQHMLAVLRPGGAVVTVMPHGVLFRGSVERTIRTGLLDEDILDTVIGLGPNLFYGTAIPACILVLRAPGSKIATRRGKVLFINADREYHEDRAQNVIHPEHVEKIVSALEDGGEIPGFASMISREELRANDDNLNIRRYVDNSPPIEPQDVRAHLHGGIPASEVDAKSAMFSTQGLDPSTLIADRGDGYFDFTESVSKRSDLRRRVADDPGILAQSAALRSTVDVWWRDHKIGIVELPTTRQLMSLRSNLLTSFQTAVRPTAVLDRFQVAGVIASWWGENQNDLRTIAARGFHGLLEAWDESIASALEDKFKSSRGNGIDHKLVRALLPEHLADLQQAQAHRAELEAKLNPAAGDAEEESNGGEDAEELSAEETASAKKQLTGVKKQLRVLQRDLVARISSARCALDDSSAERLVLGILEADLTSTLDRSVASQHSLVASAFESWWDKYRVPLWAVEQERSGATRRIGELLSGLGYSYGPPTDIPL